MPDMSSQFAAPMVNCKPASRADGSAMAWPRMDSTRLADNAHSAK